MRQKHEGISLARRVGFGSEECCHEFRSIRNEMLKLFVNGEDRKYSILADV